MKQIKALDGNRMTKKGIFLMYFSAIAFLAMTAYGAIKITDATYPASQATLILLEGVVGFVLSWFPVFVHKIFKLFISFAIQLIVSVFMFLAMILGEVFRLYYRVTWWDSMLHVFSGFGIAFVAYCLINMAIKFSGFRSQFLICLVGAIVISLAIGLLWEIAEFSIDTLFGTNMQKFMPDKFFNGGQTNAQLVGTPEEIAEFYASPQGYRFALMDTMEDIVLCVGGTGAFSILAALTKKSAVYSTAIVKDNSVRARIRKPARVKKPAFASSAVINELPEDNNDCNLDHAA